MRIGELARRSGFSIDTLRWYDRIGLVRPARREPESRFRDYGEETLPLLDLVKWAKRAGLGLSRIRKILPAARRGAACGAVVPLLGEKVAEIDRAIRELRELRARLVRALRKGARRRLPGGRSCPILRELGNGT